jgi:hypothetical protein
MKALTISQPFASLIASGEKWIENRTWCTSYRGPIAIHAGKGTQYMTRTELASVPHGCVIATAHLEYCVQLSIVQSMVKSGRCDHPLTGSTRTFRDLSQHKHAEGPWLWVLRDIVTLADPVYVSGAQGLWDWNQ